MTPSRIHIAIALAAALAFTAACGGSDDGGGENGGEEEAAALEQAVRDHTEAYFTDPAAAYAMLSERCADELDEDEYTAQLEQFAADLGQLSVETFSVDEIDGDEAHVTYTVGVPMIDGGLVGQPWVREDGEWRYDAC
ncbi:hypothetical protein [Streptomyces sp. NBC_01803]|uniref:hypothetical protein n=1 Tax=Streptomyces sp. NBC_01803 TaxID=2975946 RepID=UPI002DD9912B|nr:hypothetical protein [Streptomyces sp. NBC_01803]WSA43024.1 hypothetical protein OIE51_01730 [Streptomyces sp. NBC_01803]